jgi:hypothetical protein
VPHAESSIEAAVAHMLDRPGRNAVLQLDLEPGVKVEYRAHELPEPDERRIEDRSYARLAGELASQVLRQIAEFAGRARGSPAPSAAAPGPPG